MSDDAHARARRDTEVFLASKVGKEISRNCASSGKPTLWTVVRFDTQPFELDEPRLSPFFGMSGGLPLLPLGEPDIFALWLVLDPGDMSIHLEIINAPSLHGNNMQQQQHGTRIRSVLGLDSRSPAIFREGEEPMVELWGAFWVVIGPELRTTHGTTTARDNPSSHSRDMS